MDKTTTGDGIVAALQVLACMIRDQKSLQELAADVQLLPQTLINIKTSNAKQLAEHSRVMEVVATLSNEWQGEGRILLRPSGTEPVLRIMVEGKDGNKVKMLSQQLTDEIMHIEKQYFTIPATPPYN
ncbi:phosphoglucomutase/phosphomannomutase [Legionella hackeliae]|nr:phosphoglucomutase/phosphomannomutase [Legionella hackeliae]